MSLKTFVGEITVIYRGVDISSEVRYYTIDPLQTVNTTCGYITDDREVTLELKDGYTIHSYMGETEITYTRGDK